jgi:polyferredoxin
MGDGWTRLRDFVCGRWFFKTAFLAFFVFSVVQLLRFQAWARGEGAYVHRPETVAGILPIGHFTSFFAWLRGGGWDTYLPAGLVIILAALALSVLFKRGFCGWICPVGTIWEACSALGRRLMGGRNVRLPKWMDLAGRGFRYLLAALFMFALLMVPLQAAVEFRVIPYMWIADIKIIRLMANPVWLLVALFAGGLSILFGPVWCRYLCPLGGLYSAVGMASPCAVTRYAEMCIHCHACSQSCHAFVEPEKSGRVIAPECDGCMDCVRACPVDGCLEARVIGGTRIAPWVWPLLVVGLWLSIWGFSKVTGNWDTTVSDDQFRQIINSGIIEQKTRGFFE